MGEILSVKLHTEQHCLWPQAVVQRVSLEGCMYKQQFSIQTEMHDTILKVDLFAPSRVKKKRIKIF